MVAGVCVWVGGGESLWARCLLRGGGLGGAVLFFEFRGGGGVGVGRRGGGYRANDLGTGSRAGCHCDDRTRQGGDVPALPCVSLRVSLRCCAELRSRLPAIPVRIPFSIPIPHRIPFPNSVTVHVPFSISVHVPISISIVSIHVSAVSISGQVHVVHHGCSGDWSPSSDGAAVTVTHYVPRA